MKKNIIYKIVIILVPVLTLLIAIPLIYGWYVNVIRTGKIDASTKDVSITYTIADGYQTSTNSYTYEIDNLAFFDINNSDETGYFNSMALAVDLTLTNTSNSDMTYTVTFSSTKIVNSGVSTSYVACYYKQITNETFINDLKSNGTVSGNTIAFTDASDSFTVSCQSQTGALKAKTDNDDTDVITIRFYLIGVQEVDTATNTDFLYSEFGNTRTFTPHSFTLQITGNPISNSSAEEIIPED